MNLPLTLLAVVLFVSTPSLAAHEPPLKVARILIVPADGPWYIQVRPDGSADTRLREDLNIAATLPPGSFDFHALTHCLARLRTKQKPESPTHAGLLLAGNDNADGFYLKDDTLIRYLVLQLADAWQGDDRFKAAIHAQPMFPANPQNREN